MPTKTTRTRKTASRSTARDAAPDIADGPPVPHPLTEDELRLVSGELSTDDVAAGSSVAGPEPTMQPPGAAATALDTAAGAITGQKVTALWAEKTAGNAHANLQTAGWKKLAHQSDSGSTVLTLLAAHARATGTAPVVQENPAGTIMSMYVW